MKHFKKNVSLVLALAFAATAAACAGGGGDKPGNSKGTQSQPTGDNDRLNANDGIEAVDFKGLQYKISISDNQEFEMFSDDTTDTVDAAVYERNMRVEDKYKIEIVPVITTGYSSGAGQLLHEEDIKKSISTGDHAFDTVLMCAWRAGTLIVDGYFRDWNNNIPGVNFAQPWWNSRCNNAFTIDGKLYASVGDISLTTLALAHCYLYNKTMGADKKIDDLYTVVRDGKWTIDYVKQITKDIYTDMNKDGNRGTDDVYGFASGVVTNLDAYLPSFGISLVSADSSGDLTIAIDKDRARVQTALEKVSDLFYNSEGSYISMEHSEYNDRFKMFAEGRVLLTDATVNILSSYCRDMNDSYGVLPYPKFNEEQKDYYSNAHDNFSVLCVANNIENDELVGKVTETLCCETYRTVITAYYDTALKSKYTETDDDEDMLDMIMEGRNYDLAVLFAPSLDRLFYFFRDEIADKSTSVAGSLDSRIMGWRAALMRIEKIYGNLSA